MSVDKNSLRIAIYGKGGIGKSTVSANLSYMFSKSGLSVLQIGCDPKHDSTRALTKGKGQTTVLDALKGGGKVELEDVVLRTDCGVDCVESGGPEPGIGCAGRGIITTMNELDRLGLDKSSYDVILYDVLGDVVCGGFAVPLRRDYSDVIYIVTSGEFMSIYAANNILRGARNYNPEIPRIGGLILNRKGMEDEDDIVDRFAESVGLPIVARLSRDGLYASAEAEGSTVCELYPDSVPAYEYSVLHERIIGPTEDMRELYTPLPLNDDMLDSLLKGRRVPRNDQYPGKGGIRRESSSLEACAARGAVSAASGVVDMPVIVHGPRACGYNMANIRDVHLLSDVKTRSVFSTSFADNIFCTDLSNMDSIFGSEAKLKEMVRRLYADGKRTMMVVTTCIPGIIGTDMMSVKESLERELDGLELLVVQADGNLTGDVLRGISDVRVQLVGLIDPGRTRREGVVNLISVSGMGKKPDTAQIREMLSHLGYTLGMVLFKDCTLEQIRDAGTAEFTIPMTRGDSSSDLAMILERRGLKVLMEPLPIGIKDTANWLRSLENNDNSESVQSYISRYTREYEDATENARKMTAGKSVYVALRFNNNMDWVVETLNNLGMDVVKVTRIGRNGTSPLKNPDLAPVSIGMSPTELEGDIRRSRPDLLLTDVPIRISSDVCTGTIPGGNIGIRASIVLAEFVSNILKVFLGRKEVTD